jgi:hypothetical protein
MTTSTKRLHDTNAQEMKKKRVRKLMNTEMIEIQTEPFPPRNTKRSQLH